jgi:putative ABC transport system substrate-binding protein
MGGLVGPDGRIRRRSLLGGAGLVTLAATVAFGTWAANRTRRPLVGAVSGSDPDTTLPLRSAFDDGLREHGYMPGDDISVEWRFALGQADLVPTLIAELVHDGADVLLVSVPIAGLRAAHDIIGNTPVVLVDIGDPVGAGIVPSLARPGGNITGVSAGEQLYAKRLELITEAFPDVTRLGVLWVPDSTSGVPGQVMDAAGRLGATVELLGVRSVDEVAAALKSAIASGLEALVVVQNPLLRVNRVEIVALVTGRVPTMYSERAFVEVGGLIAYGPNRPALYRRAAAYVDRVLHGSHPGDLPIEQPTTFECVISTSALSALNRQLNPGVVSQVTEWLE